jgi:hypothetical protein
LQIKYKIKYFISQKFSENHDMPDKIFTFSQFLDLFRLQAFVTDIGRNRKNTSETTSCLTVRDIEIYLFHGQRPQLLLIKLYHISKKIEK